MTTVNDVHEGLSASPKELHHNFCFGGNAGKLFAKLRSHPDYYLHRSDLQNCATAAKDLEPLVNKESVFVEFGCGLCEKSVPCLKELTDISTFVAVDIDPVVLEDGKNLMQKEFPDLKIVTQVADVFKPFELPVTGKPTVGLIAGGLFHIFPKDAIVDLIRNRLDALGEGGILLASFDTNTDPVSNLKAYTNEACASLVMNALVMVNSEYGANFDLDQFKHVGIFDTENKSMDHYLEAQSRQVIKVDGKEYVFEAGERARIFQCHKRSVDEVAEYARIAGGILRKSYFDQQGFLCLAWIEKSH